MNVAFLALFGSLFLAAGAQGAAEKDKFDFGKHEFMVRCAVCHGQSGKGDGGAEFLKVAPSDLTVLSKKNGGTFPYNRVYQVIDGRITVTGHGTRDMPIWGDHYSTDGIAAAEYYVDIPYSMEMYARNRMLALMDYVSRIQAK
jgi:mono/diheme cytochrome c family protein